jgi:anti-anti-sigma regulatory factor
MFRTEQANKLYIFQSDHEFITEDVAVEVEKDYHDLDRSGPCNVIIDLSGVEFMTSHFANFIMRVHQDTQNKGGQLVVCSVNEHLLGMLTRLHFTTVIVIACDQWAARQIIYGNEKPSPV